MKNKVINLSEILESACAISLAIACKTMSYTEIHPVEGQEKTLIDNYLPEYSEILIKYFGDTDEYVFTSDRINEKRINIKKEIKKYFEQSNKNIPDAIDEIMDSDIYNRKRRLEICELFNSGIYNLALLLASIDKCEDYDDEILYCNSINEYEKGTLLLTEKMELLCMIHLGVSNFIIERAQRNAVFEWTKHYNVAPDMQYIIDNLRKFQIERRLLVKITL